MDSSFFLWEVCFVLYKTEIELSTFCFEYNSIKVFFNKFSYFFVVMRLENSQEFVYSL